MRRILGVFLVLFFLISFFGCAGYPHRHHPPLTPEQQKALQAHEQGFWEGYNTKSPEAIQRARELGRQRGETAAEQSILGPLGGGSKYAPGPIYQTVPQSPVQVMPGMPVPALRTPPLY